MHRAELGERSMPVCLLVRACLEACHQDPSLAPSPRVRFQLAAVTVGLPSCAALAGCCIPPAGRGAVALRGNGTQASESLPGPGPAGPDLHSGTLQVPTHAPTVSSCPSGYQP